MTNNVTDETGETPRLHGDLLSTSLLALLKAYDAYGYELGKRLSEAGLANYDTGTVYRTLRQLEKTGLVSSFWDTSANGPAKRMYSLTATGTMFLENWLGMMQSYQRLLEDAMGTIPSDEDTP